ncbi:hypothetical protein PSTT_11222 [Puccinia striiformis]|uniref:Uncharacterized protein n=1 Tax=Puccinia striiformis TaxID=27350 RepID=A0A2S4V179_9BASI|nr:hypothetical protein PSTT_11222 [Puccinia striiformis]
MGSMVQAATINRKSSIAVGIGSIPNSNNNTGGEKIGLSTSTNPTGGISVAGSSSISNTGAPVTISLKTPGGGSGSIASSSSSSIALGTQNDKPLTNTIIQILLFHLPLNLTGNPVPSFPFLSPPTLRRKIKASKLFIP